MNYHMYALPACEKDVLCSHEECVGYHTIHICHYHIYALPVCEKDVLCSHEECVGYHTIHIRHVLWCSILLED